ncbi:MAG TPA: rhamnulokinase family protein [Phycisphaerae bacterium]
MNHKYIAIDLGAESGRVMLGELSAAGIALTEVHRFPNIQIALTHRHGQTLHWDILRLWHEIKTGLAKVVAQHGAGVESLAVDVWGVDFGLLDEHGALLANPVCYRDPRTDGMVDAVFSKLSKDRIYAITGIQTMSLNTLFQLAALSFKKSPVLPLAKQILFLPDLFSYWLSGEMGTEYTIASTSQMLDARSRAWSPEILALLGLDAGIFPPVQMPGQRDSIRGTLLPAANEHLAAAGAKVLAVGSHDTASAVAAVPADESRGDWLYLSSGTWSLLGAEVDQPVLTPKAAQYNVTNEGGIGTGAGGKIRLLKNIAGLFLLQECRRHWSREGHDLDYASLTALAEKAPTNLALLDMDDPAFSTTGDMPEKILAHCRRSNQKSPSNPGEFARVILESLAHSYARVARMMEELTGKSFKTLHIVGGGSQNNLLNQLAADSTAMRVLAGPVEATALGNIMTQAVTMGALPSISAGRQLVRRSVGVKEFNPR